MQDRTLEYGILSVIVVFIFWRMYVKNRQFFRKFNTKRRRRILKDLRNQFEDFFDSREEGDSAAISDYYNFLQIVDEYGFTSQDFGHKNFDVLRVEVYESFCRHMSYWRDQHEALEQKIIELHSAPVTEYLSSISQMGSAYEKSAEELQRLETEASAFWSMHIGTKEDKAELRKLVSDLEKEFEGEAPSGNSASKI